MGNKWLFLLKLSRRHIYGAFVRDTQA